MMRFNKAKQEYTEIKAPETLKIKTQKKLKGKSVIFKISTLAASVAVAAIVAVNVIPNLAYAMAKVPVLQGVVQVVTFGRYEHKEETYKAEVVTPQIEGLLDKELEDKLNAEFKENAAAVIAAFEQDVKAMQAEGDAYYIDINPDLTVSEHSGHIDIEFNYTTKVDTDDLLVLDVYMVNNVGSSSTTHSFYTIRKQTGELVTLEGLFKKDADYVTVISDYVKKEMQRQNDAGSGMFWIAGDGNPFGGFDKISAEQNFYLNADNELVICFDKYEVAPGAAGCPEIVVPHAAIQKLLK